MPIAESIEHTDIPMGYWCINGIIFSRARGLNTTLEKDEKAQEKDDISQLFISWLRNGGSPTKTMSVDAKS